MTEMEIWNKIVSLYKENFGNEEYQLQTLWENIFKEYLNYSSLNKEIETKRTIHLGSSDRVIPDIILRKDNRDVIVVELKKSNISFVEKYKLQLFSYLKQIKVNIGVIISNKIYLFLYDYLKEDTKQKCVEIDFIENSLVGEKFVNLLTKNNLNLELIKKFILNNEKIKDEIIEIKKTINETYLKNILKNYLLNNGYNDVSVDDYLTEVEITIKEKNLQNYTSIGLIKEINDIKPISSFGKSNSYNLDKNEAIRICQKNNVPISNYITFANLSNINGKYPANVNLSYLNYEWTILLNDGFHKKLHILTIPANTFNQNDFYIRKDKNLIVLGIDNDFVDYHPQQNIINRLFEYKAKTLEYEDK